MSPPRAIPADERLALVVDAADLYRRALAMILRLECGFQTVLEAATLDEALALLETNGAIRFATFDLGFRGPSSLDAVSTIRALYPELRTVAVAEPRGREEIFSAMSAGLHGYIPKDLPSAEIVEALEQVVLGSVYLPWSVTQLARPDDAKWRRPARPITIRSPITIRQRDILRFLKEGKSNKEIARSLGLAEATVKCHTHALYRALGVRNRLEAIAIPVEYCR